MTKKQEHRGNTPTLNTAIDMTANDTRMLVCDVDKLLTLTGGLMMSSAHTLQRGGQPGPLGCMLSTV